MNGAGTGTARVAPLSAEEKARLQAERKVQELVNLQKALAFFYEHAEYFAAAFIDQEAFVAWGMQSENQAGFTAIHELLIDSLSISKSAFAEFPDALRGCLPLESKEESTPEGLLQGNIAKAVQLLQKYKSLVGALLQIQEKQSATVSKWYRDHNKQARVWQGLHENDFSSVRELDKALMFFQAALVQQIGQKLEDGKYSASILNTIDYSSEEYNENGVKRRLTTGVSLPSMMSAVEGADLKSVTFTKEVELIKGKKGIQRQTVRVFTPEHAAKLRPPVLDEQILKLMELTQYLWNVRQGLYSANEKKLFDMANLEQVMADVRQKLADNNVELTAELETALSKRVLDEDGFIPNPEVDAFVVEHNTLLDAEGSFCTEQQAEAASAGYSEADIAEQLRFIGLRREVLNNKALHPQERVEQYNQLTTQQAEQDQFICARTEKLDAAEAFYTAQRAKATKADYSASAIAAGLEGIVLRRAILNNRELAPQERIGQYEQLTAQLFASDEFVIRQNRTLDVEESGYDKQQADASMYGYEIFGLKTRQDFLNAKRTVLNNRELHPQERVAKYHQLCEHDALLRFAETLDGALLACQVGGVHDVLAMYEGDDLAAFLAAIEFTTERLARSGGRDEPVLRTVIKIKSGHQDNEILKKSMHLIKAIDTMDIVRQAISVGHNLSTDDLPLYMKRAVDTTRELAETTGFAYPKYVTEVLELVDANGKVNTSKLARYQKAQQKFNRKQYEEVEGYHRRQLANMQGESPGDAFRKDTGPDGFARMYAKQWTEMDGRSVRARIPTIYTLKAGQEEKASDDAKLIAKKMAVAQDMREALCDPALSPQQRLAIHMELLHKPEHREVLAQQRASTHGPLYSGGARLLQGLDFAVKSVFTLGIYAAVQVARHYKDKGATMFATKGQQVLSDMDQTTAKLVEITGPSKPLLQRLGLGRAAAAG